MILRNAYVLRNWKSNIEKVDIKIDNGKIIKIAENLKDYEDEEFDLDNKLIIPGLVNTHTHAAMSILRGIAEDLPFNKWLFENIIPLEEKLNEDIVYFASMLSMMEMSKNGIVAFCDMYMFEDSVAKAVKDFGMKALLTRGLVSEEDKIEKNRLKESISLFEKWHGIDNRIFVGLGPHAPYTCSLEALKEVSKLSCKLKIPVTMHLFENKWEKEQFSLSQILSSGIADYHFLAVHCVHLDDNDIKMLKEFNVFISHNPTSNLKLGNGIAPIQKMIENGLTVALGTDGPASNNSLDILFEARIASLLQKKDNPQNLDINQMLKMLTINGKFTYYNGTFPSIDEKEVYRKFSTFYKKVIGIEN